MPFRTHERSFWLSRRSGRAATGRAVGRREALRAGGVALTGIAGAALIGCSGEDDRARTLTAPPTGSRTATPSVRAAPGSYDGPVPATAAELSHRANAKRGGTLRMRYLEPPHLDINRTLSCTTYHPLSYALSRLTRARTGATADPFMVEIEPDLAESWVVNSDATEFVFHLRRGVKTHNRPPVFGREFTAEDVRLSWERYRASGSQRDVYASLAEIVTPDDHTIVARLDQPQVEFAAGIASWS